MKEKQPFRTLEIDTFVGNVGSPDIVEAPIFGSIFLGVRQTPFSFLSLSVPVPGNPGLNLRQHKFGLLSRSRPGNDTSLYLWFL
jgi:hypothetical protein